MIDFFIENQLNDSLESYKINYFSLNNLREFLFVYSIKEIMLSQRERDFLNSLMTGVNMEGFSEDYLSVLKHRIKKRLRDVENDLQLILNVTKRTKYFETEIKMIQNLFHLLPENIPATKKS